MCSVNSRHKFLTKGQPTGSKQSSFRRDSHHLSHEHPHLLTAGNLPQTIPCKNILFYFSSCHCLSHNTPCASPWFDLLPRRIHIGSHAARIVDTWHQKLGDEGGDVAMDAVVEVMHAGDTELCSTISSLKNYHVPGSRLIVVRSSMGNGHLQSIDGRALRKLDPPIALEDYQPNQIPRSGRITVHSAVMPLPPWTEESCVCCTASSTLEHFEDNLKPTPVWVLCVDQCSDAELCGYLPANFNARSGAHGGHPISMSFFCGNILNRIEPAHLTSAADADIQVCGRITSIPVNFKPGHTSHPRYLTSRCRSPGSSTLPSS